MKRGISSLITLLGKGSKQSDEDDLMVHPNLSSLAVTRSGLSAGFTHANDSNATTVVRPLRLRLTGAQTPEAISPRSAPISPQIEADIGDDAIQALPCSLSMQGSRRDLRRSQSIPGLSFMISQKLTQAFGSPTTVKRPASRARPSVHHPHSTLQHTNGFQLSSSPSTYTSWSASSPQDVQTSTPGTSDPVTLSPATVHHHEGIALVDNDQAVHFAHDLTDQPRLTPIPEGAVLPGLSIATVEATATAKIFFEAHFHLLLHGPDTRGTRRYELEKKLKELAMSETILQRILTTWERNESENIRLERSFKASEVGRKKGESPAVGKYEVIKVLGKGSFGVVRLVKEKPLLHASGRIGSAAEMIRHISQTLVKSPHREAVSAFPSRRRELSNVKKEVYAMKVIRKSDMVRNSQEGHLRAERDFLVAAQDSKWIIPLIEAFQDTKLLYLVMDFCIGGDFLGLLIRKNTLSEEITKWYVAEMILCVEEAHRMRWIHRDVKPDNFLIGADGHLKISDFGLAFDGEWYHDQRFYHKHRHDLLDKLGLDLTGDEQDLQEEAALENSRRVAYAFSHSGKPSKHAADNEPPATEPVLDWRHRTQRRRLARSVVGTSQYMAPEVIRGDLYDGRCDWWSIGIIMYECLYGYTPFACEDRHNTKLKILKHKQTLTFPECEPTRQPSMEAIDLMQCLLVEKERRLCSRVYELNDFTRRLVGGQKVKFVADKASKHYTGLFVYPDDAKDIKLHPYFRDIHWEKMLERRPPFVPRVKDWEDTKYFDEEQPISDIDSDSSDDQGVRARTHESEKDNDEANATPEVEQGSRASQHYHEDQHIIPSTALKLNEKQKVVTWNTPDGNTIAAAKPELEATEGVNPALGKNKKEKKRPRDKILRDPECGRIAMKMRKKGAFLGYAYRKPKGVDEIVADVIAQEQEAIPVLSPALGYWTHPLSREEIC